MQLLLIDLHGFPSKSLLDVLSTHPAFFKNKIVRWNFKLKQSGWVAEIDDHFIIFSQTISAVNISSANCEPLRSHNHGVLVAV